MVIAAWFDVSRHDSLNAFVCSLRQFFVERHVESWGYCSILLVLVPVPA